MFIKYLIILSKFYNIIKRKPTNIKILNKIILSFELF